MARPSPQDVTKLLVEAARGEEPATTALLPMVYAELRALAGAYFRRDGAGHTLQPTAVVHEAFLKLVGSETPSWESRAHFLAVASKAMRQVLTDHARRKRAAKRGGQRKRLTLSGLEGTPPAESEIDLLALEDALGKLAELAPRQARIVEMRFFAGLGTKDVAHVLGVSTRTVDREWRVARAFLRSELSRDRLS